MHIQNPSGRIEICASTSTQQHAWLQPETLTPPTSFNGGVFFNRGLEGNKVWEC